MFFKSKQARAGILCIVITMCTISCIEQVQAQPHLQARAFILINADNNDVLVENNSNIKYSSSFGIKLGLSIGIIHGVIQERTDRLNNVSQILLNNFSDNSGLKLANILGSLYTYDGEILESGNFAEELVHLLQYAYNEAGASINIRGPSDIRDGTVLISLKDMTRCITHLLELQSSVVPVLSGRHEYDFIENISIIHNEELNSPWFFEVEDHYILYSSRNDLNFISAVYDSHDLVDDASNLIEYGFSNYKRYIHAHKNEIIDYLKVEGAIDTSVGLVLTDDISMIIKKDVPGEIEMRLQIKQPFEPPIKAHEVVGYVEVYKNDEIIKTVDLMVDRNVTKKDIPAKAWEWFIYLVKLFG